MSLLKNAFFLLINLALLSSNIPTVQAQKKEEMLWIDKFDRKDFKTLTTGDWYSYSDVSNGGASYIKKVYYKNRDLKSQVLQYSYVLQQGGWRWNPYVALACSLSTAQVRPGVQAIAYEYKGKEHSFIYRSNDVKDYCFYQKLIPESKEWTTVIIPLSELAQPDWGKKVKFKAAEINALAWQVTGMSNDSGTLAIDNVRLLYTPQKPTTAALSNTITLGTTEKIYSKILDEDRTLWIYLPQKMEQLKASKLKYPVVYLLDGDGHFKALSGILSQLASGGLENSPFPEMIVVGITNTDRMRDLSPSNVKKSPFRADTTGLGATGGGNNFMNFIEKELIPHIDSVYPTSSYRMFIGHSLGGLTVLNTLVHRPHLFNSYLAIDPSLWWDNQLLIKQTDSVFNKTKMENKKVFISMANTMYSGVDTSKIRKNSSVQASHMRSILRFTDVCKKYKDNGLQLKYTYYPEESHGSVPVISEYDGMRYFFNFYKLPFLDHLEEEHFNIDSAFSEHYKNISREMGYVVLPPENRINSYGYYFLYQKKKPYKAYSFFKMNTVNYPQSSNAFDSLGGYYEVIGDKEKAIEAYTKALSIAEIPFTRNKLEKIKK